MSSTRQPGKGSFAKHGEIQLWVESFGEPKNQTLLLVSGAMASARLWTDEFCMQIADQGFHVIRFDQRDIGLSSGIDFDKDPYNLRDLAQDAFIVLDHFNIERAHIAGLSSGGSIAQLMSLAQPQRCASLTLISTPAPETLLSQAQEEELQETWKVYGKNKPTLNFEESFQGFRASYQYLNGSYSLDEDMLKTYVQDFYERSNHMYLTDTRQVKAFEVPHPHVKAQFNHNITKDELSNILAPVLIIHGDKDKAAFPVHAQQNHREIRKSTLHIVPGMGHMMLNRDLEKTIATLLVEFLEKVE